MDMNKFKELDVGQGLAKKFAENIKSLNFSFKGIPTSDTLLNKPTFDNSIIKSIDRRTRQEISEDRELELSKIEISDIEEAQSFINGDVDIQQMDEKEIFRKQELVKDCIEKLLCYKNTFDQLNSDHYRRITLKEHELKVEAAADWNEKWRTFWFRVLGSGLLIVTLFAIGTLNHNISWLYLPFESVIKPGFSNTTIGTQALLVESNNQQNAVNQAEAINPPPIHNDVNLHPRPGIDTTASGKK